MSQGELRVGTEGMVPRWERGMSCVLHTINPSTREAEACPSLCRVLGQPGLWSETLYQKKMVNIHCMKFSKCKREVFEAGSYYVAPTVLELRDPPASAL